MIFRGSTTDCASIFFVARVRRPRISSHDQGKDISWQVGVKDGEKLPLSRLLIKQSLGLGGFLYGE